MQKDGDDVSIWGSFLAGDHQAYEYIYKQNIQKLFLYGMTLTSDEELVKDCIHDIFIHIYKNRQNLGKTNNIRFYLISALKNKILMVFRKQKTYDKFKNSLDEEPVEINTAIDNIISAESEIERKAQIDHIWSVLTTRQKKIIYYKYVEGLSISEIAKKENIDYHSVANIIQRAIKKMRNFYFKSD
ncbi:MAG: sigma-70 family RNA polymerase sigma factor [Bacteroidales bacterium]|jgi:RNA polymerase sigma factor (sigma-70 family)|nr:sigma-70 family RNA polymerase sigma factor [Bacteroidales bacterium]